MNLTNPTTTTATTTTPETDTDTPPTKLPDQHHQAKVLSFTNGALKHHHHHHHVAAHPSPPIYKECMKNHAASLGGHALDGCGEFMPSPTATASDLTSLKCAACGCHRNFHRRDPDDSAAHIVEYLPHPHQVLPPRRRSPSSVSPPPISSSYYPSAPHMLLALSARGGALAGKHEVVNHNHNNHHHQTAPATTPSSGAGSGRKRFRTKFSQEQKEKMLSFSERLGWKMQKRDEGLVEEFCNEVGVGKGVLKVWMHNNKHTFGKRSDHVNTNNSSSELHSDEIPNENDNNAISTITTLNHHHHHHHHQLNHDQSGSGGADAVNNGSSSSS